MKKTTALAAAVIMSITGTSVMASQGKVDTQELLTKSDLVFQGKVINVDYKDSTDGIPHTFVTYSVEDMIAGEATEIIKCLSIGG